LQKFLLLLNLKIIAFLRRFSRKNLPLIWEIWERGEEGKSNLSPSPWVGDKRVFGERKI